MPGAARQIRAVPLLVPLLLLLPAASRADTREASSFTVGSWRGGLYQDAETGAFSHCAVVGRYRSGIHLAFSIDGSYDLQLALGYPGWELGHAELYSVALFVDGHPLGTFVARSREHRFLNIDIGNDGYAYDLLRGGYTLLVRAQQGDFRFELTGTARALARLKQCVDGAVLAPPGGSNPFAPPGANPFAPPGTAPEAISPQTLRALLDAAGEASAKIFPGSSLGFPAIPWVWTVDGTIGLLGEFPAEGYSLDSAAASLLAGVGSECKGRYASASRPTERIGAWQFKDGFGSCASEGTVASAYFTTVTNGSSILVVCVFADEYRSQRAQHSLGSIRSVLEELAQGQ